MKFGTFKKAIAPLIDDTVEAEDYLEKNLSSQFARRAYIRSIFAYIEGSLWILKQVCLQGKVPTNKPSPFSLSEYVILREESYELKNNGTTKVSAKALNLLDNIKFTFKIISRFFYPEIDLGTGTKSWTNLVQVKKIRNRITHPKRRKDLEITDEEIEVCQEVASWFTILMKNFLERLLDNIMLYDRDKKILKTAKEVKQTFEDFNAKSKKN